MGEFVSPAAHRYRAFFVDASAAPENNQVAFSDPIPGRLRILRDEIPEGYVPSSDSQNATFEAWLIPSALKDSPLAKEVSRAWIESAALAHACIPVSVRSGEILVVWAPGRAIITTPLAHAVAAWDSLLDFAYHEGELRKIEADIRAAWPGLEEDTPLAYDVHKHDLRRDAQIAQRARSVLALRTRLARLEPRLDSVPARFCPAAAHIAEALREKARCEDRLQYADAQIEVQESVYEMASQRLGEFRNARSTFVTEAIIIVLLGAEVILMLWEALSH